MPRRNDISKILIIGCRPGLLAGFAMLFLICILVPLPTQACSISLSTVRVSSDFRVIVSHGSTPVPGIRVVVYNDESQAILKQITSRDGAAEIKNLRPGRYIVQTEGPGMGSAVYAVVDDKSGKGRNEIALEWPFSWRGTLKTKSLSGELVSNDPWKPLQNVQVELWAAGLDAPLAALETGPLGRFRFDETRPGIYVVRVLGRQPDANPGNQIEGDLSVELSPSAPDAPDFLSLRLGMTTCGIQYGTCPADHDAPMAMASRRIQVGNGPGIGGENPMIENAKFKLLDERGASIAEGTTDHDGIADLPSEVQGKVTLVVASSLLTTVQQSLNLLPADEHAPKLQVFMTMLGSNSGCSAVRLEKHATPQ